METLRKFLFIRIATILVILLLAGIAIDYIIDSSRNANLEKRKLRLEQTKKEVLSHLNSSFEYFALLVSGTKSFIDISPEMPGSHRLREFVLKQLVETNYKGDLAVAYLDTTHTFRFVFTRNEIDPANLEGVQLITVRDSAEIEKLNKLLQTDGIHIYDPINTKEGWLGIPIDFRVVKENVAIGYIAALLNLRVVLDEIYTHLDPDEFVLRFLTKDSVDFDRSAIYDGSQVYNQSDDKESFKNFNIDPLEMQYETVEYYGERIIFGIAYKENYHDKQSEKYLLFGWYFTLIIFLGVATYRLYQIKRLNIKYYEANRRLAEQKEQIAKQNEQVQSNLNFVRKINDLSPVLIYIFNTEEKRNIYENRNIYEYLGHEKDDRYSDAELFKHYIHPDDLVSGREQLKRYLALNEGESLDSLVRFKDAKGMWRWILGKEVVFKRKPDGRPEEILGVAEDVTKVKLIESELQESERRLNEAQNISKIGNWEIDLSTAESSVSEEFFSIFGLESKSEKAKLKKDANYFRTFIHPDDYEHVNTSYLKGLKLGQKYAVDYRIIDLKGEIKYIHSIVNIVCSDEGQPVKTWGTIQDITSRKLIEQQLEAQYSELENVNVELERFVYRVTHDLRAPLGNVHGLIELLKMEGESNSEQKRYFKMIQSSIASMNEFIDDLLIYSKNVNLEVQKEVIDLNLLFAQIIEEHQFLEGAEQITFQNDIPEGTEIISDHGRVRIVFNNLISNAIKYHDLSKEKPIINVSSKISGHIISMMVQDNGIGMKKEDVEKIFDMFYRSSNKSSNVKGTGIGLFILKETLSKINGEISVNSEFGQGSTFKVDLPIS